MSSMIFTIRGYTAQDKNTVRKLYELASVHSEIGYRRGPWEKDLDAIEEYYLQNGDFLVGLLDNTIIAFGGLQKISDGIAHIRRMRVHPDYRRKGFAQQILKSLEQTAKRNGIKELRLRTSTKQIMAQQFYEKNGFTRMPADKSYYTEGGGDVFEVIWYTKHVS